MLNIKINCSKNMNIASLNPKFVSCDHVKLVCLSFLAQLVKLAPFLLGDDYVMLEWSSKSETRPQPGQHVLSFGTKFGH